MKILSGFAARSLLAVSAAVTPILLWSADAAALEPIERLGKHVFFDEDLSRPARQACASCHDPAKGWILPNSTINRTIVAAPGAKRRRLGSIKTPANAYASFNPVFRFEEAPFVVPWKGGAFWDGRAEGCGRSAGSPCPAASPAGAVSETIKPSDLPVSKQAAYARFLGPVADQALNPFPNDVEQNIRERAVCKRVEEAEYGRLYRLAYGEDINCQAKPKENPAYRTSFKRIAVALAAWQASTDVNSFSSKRDKELRRDPKFPLVGFSDKENKGHDLFYGITSDLNPTGKRAFCNACHSGVPEGDAPDPTGEGPRQLYMDFRYHNIGVPFNREIPEVAKGVKVGLAAHVTNVSPGEFKTPTLRNVAKGASRSFTKAYTHNGWFKSLESLVHFYNTRDALQRCETLGIKDATEKEALANNCWPAAEFSGAAVGVIGNLGLTKDEEEAIVAYLKTLSDEHTPRAP
jgi:cytochrome c peroxidase